MDAAVYREPGRIETVEVPDLVVGPDELVLDVAGCGVCGSDLASWRSGAYVEPGSVLGHEVAGRVVQGGDSGLEPGTPVAVRPLMPCQDCAYCHRGEWQLCDRAIQRGVGYGVAGGFAEQVRVPWPIVGLTVFPLPESVPLAVAPLIEPLAVSLHAVRRATPGPSDVVVVMGLGPIGLGVTAMTALHAAAHIVAVDVSARRRDAATRLGATTTVAPEDAMDAVRDITGPGGFGLGAEADIVFECSGAPAAFKEAVKVVRRGGRLVLVAHSAGPFTVRSGRLIEKELDVLGAFAYRDEFPDVIDLLAAGRLDVRDLVSHRIPLAEISRAFEVQADPVQSLKVVVEPC